MGNTGNNLTPKRVIGTFLALTAITTLANSLIWGINTLFLISAGMNIFEVMLINSAFTVGQLIFNVPTGVIADTVGRKAAYLFSTSTILLSTLLYALVGYFQLGLTAFMLSSIFLGLGFTFYTGAVDAWMVDSLRAMNYRSPVDSIFAKKGIVFGLTMLVGTTVGGLLGQQALWLPYLARALMLVPAFVIGQFFIKEIGFKTRKLKLLNFGKEFRRVFGSGIKFIAKDRVARFLMFGTFIQGLFFIYGFYSWQKYFLDLLGHNLVWVSGLIAAAIGLSQILGSSLLSALGTRITNRAPVLIVMIILQSLSIILAATAGNFYLAVSFYLVFTTSVAFMAPIKLAWLNERIPSEQRATLISLDSNFSDVSGTIGQLGLGYVSQAFSIPFAWVVGGVSQLIGIPFIYLARRLERDRS